MLAEISAGYTSLKTALSIAQGLNTANTQVQINEAKLALQQHIFEARESLAAANEAQSKSAERIRELEEEIARMKTWEADKQRYELKEIGTGQFAYALKEGMGGSEPAHHLCANCYNQGKKSLLQTETTVVGRHTVYVCHSCDSELYSSMTGGRPYDAGPRGGRR